MSKPEDFAALAKLALRLAMERFEYSFDCEFCEIPPAAGEAHAWPCPFFGYDLTDDWERLKAWAAT
jgi:hypothetical protein